MTLVSCLKNNYTPQVIPAEAGIQKKKDWMPHQVRHDTTKNVRTVRDSILEKINDSVKRCQPH